MSKDRTMLTISEMSNICRISRQTLIYYDKNDIFKPALVQDNGYRYYSIYQVPYLREICSLKDNFFPLKDIIENFEGRTIQSTIKLLTEKQDILQNEIEELKKRIRSIDDRLSFLRRAENEMVHADQPYIIHRRAEKILFRPWAEDGGMSDGMERATLHFTHMALRNMLEDMNLKTNDYGWGAMLRMDAVMGDAPLTGAGGYVNLPPDFRIPSNIPDNCIITFPEGDYACMSRFSMPYELTSAKHLIAWIDSQGYDICGDILDECLLDTTYYTENQQRDFCLLQIPIKKRP